MITKIGIVAGEIWQLLESNGTVSIEDIKSKLDRTESLILMSIGWLSREGHVLLEEEANDFKVSLREREMEKVKD